MRQGRAVGGLGFRGARLIPGLWLEPSGGPGGVGRQFRSGVQSWMAGMGPEEGREVMG